MIPTKFYSHKDHEMPFMGGPNISITNPRWRTAAILEKSPYLRNGLTTTTTTTTVLRPFFRDHPGEPVPEEYLWTLWCKGRLTEADTPTIRLGATPSGLTSAHLYHPPNGLTNRHKIWHDDTLTLSTNANVKISKT